MTLKELIAKSWKKKEWDDEIIFGEILFAPGFILKSVDSEYQSKRYKFSDALRSNFPTLLESLSNKEIQDKIKQLYGNDWERNRKNVQNWIDDSHVPQEDALIDLLSALYKEQTEFYIAQGKDREFPDKVKDVKTVIGNMLDYAGRESDEFNSDEFNKVYMRDLDNVAYMFTVLHGKNKEYYDTLKTDLKTALKQKQNSELEARLTQLKGVGDNFVQRIVVATLNAPTQIKQAIHNELPEIHAGRQGWIDLDVAWLNPADLSNNTIFEAISTDAQEALKGDSELTCNEILAQCIFNQMYNATNVQVNRLCDDLKILCDDCIRSDAKNNSQESAEDARNKIKNLNNKKNNIELIVKNSYNEVYWKAVLKAIIGSLNSVTENKTVTAMVESEIECDGVLQTRETLIKFIQCADPDWFMAKGNRSKIKACIQEINENYNLYDADAKPIIPFNEETRLLPGRTIEITDVTFNLGAFKVVQRAEEAAEKVAEGDKKAEEAAKKAAEGAEKAAKAAEKAAKATKKAAEGDKKAAEAAEKAAEDAKKAAEGAKKAAEAAQKAAEDAKKAAEAAEQAAKAAKKVAEAAEQAAKGAEKAAETAEQAAETAEQAAKAAKKAAEGDKKAVEAAEKAAKTAKQAAKTAKQAAAEAVQIAEKIYYNLCKQCIIFDKRDDLAKFKELSFRTMLLFFVAESQLQQNLDVETFNADTIRTGINDQLKAVGFVPLGARRASAADQYVEMVIGYAEELVNGG